MNKRVQKTNMERSKYRLFLKLGIVSLVLIISLSSCDPEPFLSKTETVEAFNSSIDFVKSIDESYGYSAKYNYHYASPYYKYVLYDGYAFCPEVKSYSPTFKTESDNHNGPINKYDICIDCGFTWREHRHTN